ncbi:hypothetical protein ACFVJR_30225 [Nocardia salmonicida]|uniref:hypothetical protein n=3 Tax=Nocardia salmonicida TaxID=53431 RepID=UPI00363D14A2
MTPSNPYPNLGFNPTPGSAAEVAALGTKVKTAYDAVTETNILLYRLRNSNDDVWKGDAGNAFRESFDANLAVDLSHAKNSLERASTVIQTWHGNLVSFQDTAKGLETEAAAARSTHAQAVTTLQQAKANPDLGLANQTFTDSDQLAAAQARLDTANAKLTTATTAVTNAQSAIDAIIARAKELQTTHNSVSATAAAELESAANFAPSEPDKSIWDTIGDWFKDNQEAIHDALAATSAITGLLALVTPPPISIAFGAVALVSGLGALGMNALNPEVRDAIGDVANLDFNKEALTTLGTTVGTDTLSVLPGVGGVFKGSKVFFSEADTAVSAVNMATDAASASKFSQVMTAFGDGAQSPGIATKILDSVGSKIPSSSFGVQTAGVFQDFSQASTHAASVGTTVGGIEMVSRAAKAGLGMTVAGDLIGGWYSND